jgi:biopolymer transport protein TolR
MAKKRPIGTPNSEPNVVPMADIMLVLLIIFMVVTPMLQKGVSVDLTQTTNHREIPDADKEDAVVVAITKDGNVFLGSDQKTIGDLPEEVGKIVENRVDKTVFIKSDARAKYETVVNAVDAVRSAGVEKLGLLTDKVPEGQAPPVY